MKLIIYSFHMTLMVICSYSEFCQHLLTHVIRKGVDMYKDYMKNPDEKQEKAP